MKTRRYLVPVLLLAAVPIFAAPRRKAKIRATRAPSAAPMERALPAVGEDPALARRSTGYPAVAIGEPARKFVGEPISLDLKDADIRDVLLTFSKLARLNMVIDPDVKGSVTVRLENVPWDQALDVILKVNGLGYVLDGNIVRVGSPEKL